MLAGGESVGFIHLINGLFVAGGSVAFGAGGFRDSQGIAGLKEFERQFGVQDDGIEFVAGGNVAAAIDEFKLGIHDFGSADSIRANGVLENYEVARAADGVVRLRSYDHRESLEVSGHVELAAVIVANQDFADVDGAAFGR